MNLVVHPLGIGFGVLLLLLAGRLRITGPQGEPLAVGRRSIAADVQRQRLGLLLIVLLLRLFVARG
jgi:hypothetical protein